MTAWGFNPRSYRPRTPSANGASHERPMPAVLDIDIYIRIAPDGTRPWRL